MDQGETLERTDKVSTANENDKYVLSVNTRFLLSSFSAQWGNVHKGEKYKNKPIMVTVSLAKGHITEIQLLQTHRHKESEDLRWPESHWARFW